MFYNSICEKNYKINYENLISDITKRSRVWGRERPKIQKKNQTITNFRMHNVYVANCALENAIDVFVPVHTSRSLCLLLYVLANLLIYLLM